MSCPWAPSLFWLLQPPPLCSTDNRPSHSSRLEKNSPGSSMERMTFSYFLPPNCHGGYKARVFPPLKGTHSWMSWQILIIISKDNAWCGQEPHTANIWSLGSVFIYGSFNRNGAAHNLLRPTDRIVKRNCIKTNDRKQEAKHLWRITHFKCKLQLTQVTF